jgi:ferrochelatase
MRKTAVVLFNLGGPDSLDAVRPFLFNLFYDPAILAYPNPLRWLIAKMISTRRAPVAREIYEQLGGASPLLENTWAQGGALETELNRRWAGDDHQARTFIAMRYWHPRAEAAARDVRAYGPDEVVLLPLRGPPVLPRRPRRCAVIPTSLGSSRKPRRPSSPP